MPLSTRFRAQPLCLVQRVVRVFEYVGAAAGKLGVSHRDPRAQGDGAVGAALVWNPQAFDAESHAFDSDERVRQGLFGENAQELFTAVSIQIVDATRLLLQPRADGIAHGRCLYGLRGRCAGAISALSPATREPGPASNIRLVMAGRRRLASGASRSFNL
jgi:hypothetical protein